MLVSGNALPIRLFAPEATEEKGEQARLTTFVAAIAVGDMIKTTLGPKGMDKILQSTSEQGSIQVTNDGATILKSIHLDNPAAKILVVISAVRTQSSLTGTDIAKTQDDEVGDGTTSVTVLASELLREAERLTQQKVHPQTIIAGWRLATEAARTALIQAAHSNGEDAEKFKEDLLNIARTTLSSKILAQEKDHFARIAVDAILRLKGSGNLEAIHILKKPGGSLRDSFLDEGFILEKRVGVGQPRRVENARILLANTAMDTDKIKIHSGKVQAQELHEVIEIENAEKERMLRKCEKIAAHGCNVFINRQLVYNLPEQFFAERGIMCIEHADFEGVERLALVLGAEIVSTFDHPERVRLGQCRLVEEILLGEDKAIRFSGVPLGEACTIVLRGATQQLLDEAERSLHDALCVLQQTVRDQRVVPGGGAAEMLMAKAVEDAARSTPGKRSLAVEAFARALRQLPTILADNAGLDSAELVTALRAAHHRGETTAGLDLREGRVADMHALGVTEPLRVKLAVLNSASEAAEMLLRVDEILKAPPRKREPDPGH